MVEIHCTVGALVVGDVTLKAGVNLLSAEEAEKVLERAQGAFSRGILALASAPERSTLDVGSMTVRQIREALARDEWSTDDLLSMRNAETTGSNRRTVMSAFSAAIERRASSRGPVAVVEA